MANYTVLLLLCSVFACVMGGNIWGSVPGASDNEKMDNIFNAVRLARLIFPTQICTHDAFASVDPTDFNTTQNWAGFLCSFWGGPIAAHPNCTYYFQDVRTPVNLINETGRLTQTMNSFHGSTGLNINITNAQYNLVRDILSASVASVGGSAAFASIASADFDSNLKNDIVQNAATANNACPTAASTIAWSAPTAAGSVSINANDFVTWTWSDGSQHTVESLSAGLTFLGAGSQTNSLSRTTPCSTAATACTTTSGAYSFSWRFTNAGTYAFRCNVHSTTMNGTILVGTPSMTTTADGTGIGSGSFSSSSSSSTLASWISFF